MFGAPGIIKEFVGKLTPAQEDPKKNKRDAIQRIDEVPVDDEGNVEIPREIVIGKAQDLFGDKIYETMEREIQPAVRAVSGGSDEAVKRQVQDVIDTVKESVFSNVVEPVADSYDVKKATRNKVARQVEQEIEDTFDRLQGDYIQQANIARAELEQAKREAETPEEIRQAENIFENSDFIYMLNQAAGDRQILAKQLNISPHQLSYVTHSGEGEGLLFYGNTIIPFVDHFPKDTELYRIMTTKPLEVAS